MKVTEAPEPSDIIWENLEILDEHSTVRARWIDIYMVIFMIGVFLLYAWLR